MKYFNDRKIGFEIFKCSNRMKFSIYVFTTLNWKKFTFRTHTKKLDMLTKT